MSVGKIVIDVGFGDGGKGLVVDNLCELEKQSPLYVPPLVVRFSGGQQCGHTVMTDTGIKHIFSSFGSGSLAGIPTFFTEDTTMYLPAIVNEYKILSEKCAPELMIHPLAMLTTPFDVAFNRVKEELIIKHGSCGLGVGATMKRCIETPYKTFAQDLLYPQMLIEKFKSVQRYYESQLTDAILRDRFYWHLDFLLPQFHDDLFQLNEKSYFKILQNPPRLHKNIIFEGSQGVMLDMDHGVFPNVTYANTTSKNAFKYIRKWNLQPELFYVTRCYTTRHGNGWMPNENKISLKNTEEEINVYNQWQEDFRYGEFDYDMINASIAIDECYHGDYYPRKNLVMTCLDQRDDFQLDESRIHGVDWFWKNDSPRRGKMKR